MCLKWIEIWADPAIPQPQRGGTTYLQWYLMVCKTYEKWRLLELRKAKDEKSTPPPLYPVTFREAKRWATLMKELSDLAHSHGVVNDTSAQICANWDSFIDNIDANANAAVFDGGIGASIQVGTLNTHIAEVSEGTQTFESPTSDQIDTVMRRGDDAGDDLELLRLLAEEDKPPGAKKRRSAPATDPETLRRINAAAEKMRECNIQRDPVLSKRNNPETNEEEGGKRCGVCQKYLSFNWRKVPHRMMKNDDGSQFRFCPLADDHSILKEFLIRNEAKKSERGRDKKRRSRAKKKAPA